MAVKTDLLDILVCPQCKGVLKYREELQRLDCAACKLGYHIEEDIPVMLIDDAEKLLD